MNYVIHLASRSIGSRDAANGHTDRQCYNISSIMLAFMGRKVVFYINVKLNNAMLFLCHSVSVCLSVCSIYSFEPCDRVIQIPVLTL